MRCPNCGYENESGARFCKQCGTPQAEVMQPQFAPSQPAPQATYEVPQNYGQPPYAPPQPAYNPQYSMPGTQPDAPKKKTKTALIIGICACAVVIVAAVVALVLLLPSGPSVEGFWVSEDDGIVLSAEKDELTLYSLAGAADADYDFDKKEGKGSFKTDDAEYEFTVEKDTLKLVNTDTDDTLKLSRAKDDPDIESVVTAPLLGTWSSEEAAQVLELKEDGEASAHSIDGEASATYEFDVNKGTGELDIDGAKSDFTGDGETLTVDGVVYSKASGSLDIVAFISEHSNPLLGVWYDTTGIYGSVEFFDGGTCTFTTYGVDQTCTYSFDSASGTGEIVSPDGTAGTLSYAGGTLAIDGIDFTRDYVEQQDLGDSYSDIAGSWYEPSGIGSIMFYDDGTFDMMFDSTYYYGTFTFNSSSLTGTILTDTNETLSYYLSGSSLYMEGVEFTRENPGTTGTSGTNSPVGTWYDMDGVAGTLDIYSDGTLYVTTGGTFVYGEYEYDTTSGVGTIQFYETEGETVTCYFWVIDGELTLVDETYENFVFYTKDFVAQP
jgi:hypothetical protein